MPVAGRSIFPGPLFPIRVGARMTLYPRRRTDDFEVFEHIGLYAYTRECLTKLSKLPPSRLEKIECLEQLRALENGISIQTVVTQCEGELVSVDTQEDLERVRRILAGGAK